MRNAHAQWRSEWVRPSCSASQATPNANGVRDARGDVQRAARTLLSVASLTAIGRPSFRGAPVSVATWHVTCSADCGTCMQPCRLPAARRTPHTAPYRSVMCPMCRASCRLRARRWWVDAHFMAMGTFARIGNISGDRRCAALGSEYPGSIPGVPCGCVRACLLYGACGTCCIAAAPTGRGCVTACSMQRPIRSAWATARSVRAGCRLPMRLS